MYPELISFYFETNLGQPNSLTHIRIDTWKIEEGLTYTTQCLSKHWDNQTVKIDETTQSLVTQFDDYTPTFWGSVPEKNNSLIW